MGVVNIMQQRAKEVGDQFAQNVSASSFLGKPRFNTEVAGLFTPVKPSLDLNTQFSLQQYRNNQNIERFGKDFVQMYNSTNQPSSFVSPQSSVLTQQSIQKQNFGPLNLDTSMPSYQDTVRQQQNAKTPGISRNKEGKIQIDTPGLITQATNHAINLGTSIANVIKEKQNASSSTDSGSNGGGGSTGGKASAFMSSAKGAAINAAAGLVGSAMNIISFSFVTYCLISSVVFILLYLLYQFEDL